MSIYTPSFNLIAKYLEQNNYTVSSVDLGTLSDTFVLIQSKALPKNQIIVDFKNPTYPFSTASARRIFIDKGLTYAYVAGLGLSTPSSMTVSSSSDLQLDGFLASHERVIVKPKSGHGSHGLSLNVTTSQSLRSAVENALQFSAEVLVQNQFIGEEVRFTAVDGKIRSALLRQKPHVIGDGISTIEQLIDRENSARRAVVDTAVLYPSLDATLISPDLLNSQDIPALGARVELGLGTMIRTGASMYDVIDTIDASYIEIAEKIAAPFGRGFIAIDIMIADIYQPAQPNAYIFLEINMDPAIVLYNSCRDGRHFDVIQEYLGPKIIDVIEGNAS